MSPLKFSPRHKICDDRVIDVLVSFNKLDKCAMSAFCCNIFKYSVIDADGRPPILLRRRGGDVGNGMVPAVAAADDDDGAAATFIYDDGYIEPIDVRFAVLCGFAVDNGPNALNGADVSNNTFVLPPRPSNAVVVFIKSPAVEHP